MYYNYYKYSFNMFIRIIIWGIIEKMYVLTLIGANINDFIFKVGIYRIIKCFNSPR